MNESTMTGNQIALAFGAVCLTSAFAVGLTLRALDKKFSHISTSH